MVYLLLQLWLCFVYIYHKVLVKSLLMDYIMIAMLHISSTYVHIPYKVTCKEQSVQN